MKFPIPSNATKDEIEERFLIVDDWPIDRVIWEVNWVNLPLGKRGGHLYEKSWKDWYLKSGIYELLKCIFGFFGPICIILYSYSAILYTGLFNFDRIMSKYNVIIHVYTVRLMFCLPENKMNLNLSSMEAHWRPKWKSKSHEISCYYCYDFYYLVSIGPPHCSTN